MRKVTVPDEIKANFKNENCNAAVAISFQTCDDKKVKALPVVKGKIVLNLNTTNPNLFPKKSRNISEKELILGYPNEEHASLAKEHIDELLLFEYGIEYYDLQCIRF